MGANITFKESTNEIIVNYNAKSGLALKDDNDPNVRAGNLQLLKEGDKTLVKGQITIDAPYKGAEKVFGPRLTFVNSSGEEIGTVPIVPRPSYILVSRGIFYNFEKQLLVK